MALVSALAPAREAMRGGAHRSHEPRRARAPRPPPLAARLRLVAGIAGGAGRLASQRQARWTADRSGGYVAALLAIGGAAMAAPAWCSAVDARHARPRPPAFGSEDCWPARSLTASLARTSVVVAALATAIAMMASVGIMVGSFRETVLVWLDTQLRADLYVRPPGRAGAGVYPALCRARFRGSWRRPRRRSHGCLSRAWNSATGGERATLGAGDIDIVRRYGRLRFLPRRGSRCHPAHPCPARTAPSSASPSPTSTACAPATALDHSARRPHRRPAQSPASITTIRASQGYVILDRSTLLKYLPDQPAHQSSPSTLQPGADAQAVADDLQRRLGALSRVMIAPNEALRRGAIVIFDRTFAIT